jgi:hypothetical protein
MTKQCNSELLLQFKLMYGVGMQEKCRRRSYSPCDHIWHLRLQIHRAMRSLQSLRTMLLTRRKLEATFKKLQMTFKTSWTRSRLSKHSCSKRYRPLSHRGSTKTPMRQVMSEEHHPILRLFRTLRIICVLRIIIIIRSISIMSSSSMLDSMTCICRASTMAKRPATGSDTLIPTRANITTPPHSSESQCGRPSRLRLS